MWFEIVGQSCPPSERELRVFVHKMTLRVTVVSDKRFLCGAIAPSL